MDRTEVTPSLVACLLENEFPDWAGLPVTPVELAGWDNTTFRLGDDMSVRLPSGESYSSQVAKEHRWLPALAERLPVAIPQPLAMGTPGCGYPWPWSVYRWLPGQYATVERIADLTEFACSVGKFLIALHAIDPTDGPSFGPETQFRGGPLAVWDSWTKDSIAFLGDDIDAELATEVWETALAATRVGQPVWFHGDLHASNLLVLDGHLSAVIDFGCSGVGDPACDLAIAWTFFFGESRNAFQETVSLDAAAWARARGWVLWKALVTYSQALQSDPQVADAAGLQFGWRQSARGIIEDVIADHHRHSQGRSM